jgi:micrococcal nuclease
MRTRASAARMSRHGGYVKRRSAVGTRENAGRRNPPSPTLAFLVGILALVGCIRKSDETSLVSVHGRDESSEPVFSPFAPLGPLDSGAAPGVSDPNSNLHPVVRIIDGDTIQVEIDGQLERVRYIGVDTPETVHPSKPVQCFGKEASARNQALVAGRQVRLERDVSDRDRYGRLLRYVHADGVFVNLELVRDGYAQASTHPPDVKHSEAFLAAQREARTAGRGLWTSCEPDPAELDARRPSAPAPKSEPSELRAEQCAKGNANTMVIKGNINAAGDKLYHRPDCPSYARTIIDPSRGERWFCSEEEARAAGWRRAGNCR